MFALSFVGFIIILIFAERLICHNYQFIE